MGVDDPKLPRIYRSTSEGLSNSEEIARRFVSRFPEEFSGMSIRLKESARQSVSQLMQVWPEASISRMEEAFSPAAPWWDRFEEGLIAAGVPA
jgi:hypothetical protein